MGSDGELSVTVPLLCVCVSSRRQETEQRDGLMASDASHVLEAALEQMDGILAGRSDPGFSDRETTSSRWTSLSGAERSPLLDFFYSVCHLSLSLSFWPHLQHVEVPRPGTEPTSPKPQQ